MEVKYEKYLEQEQLQLLARKSTSFHYCERPLSIPQSTIVCHIHKSIYIYNISLYIAIYNNYTYSAGMKVRCRDGCWTFGDGDLHQGMTGDTKNGDLYTQ